MNDWGLASLQSTNQVAPAQARCTVLAWVYFGNTWPIPSYCKSKFVSLELCCTKILRNLSCLFDDVARVLPSHEIALLEMAPDDRPWANEPFAWVKNVLSRCLFIKIARLAPLSAHGKFPSSDVDYRPFQELYEIPFLDCAHRVYERM